LVRLLISRSAKHHTSLGFSFIDGHQFELGRAKLTQAPMATEDRLPVPAGLPRIPLRLHADYDRSTNRRFCFCAGRAFMA
jgi:hypothetical protein